MSAQWFSHKAIIMGLLTGGVCIAMLSGCSLRQETHLSQSKAQVQQEAFQKTMTMDQMDKPAINKIANHFRRYGDGELVLTALYDPKSKKNTSVKATNDMSRIVSELRDAGIQNVNSNILPIQGQGDYSELVVSYDFYTAHGPDDCELMSGYKDNDVQIEDDYSFGCTMETVIAKQISRPKDLKGQAGEDAKSDGRRLSNTVERYRTGQPNESLGGLTASE